MAPFPAMGDDDDDLWSCGGAGKDRESNVRVPVDLDMECSIRSK
jgi:hypothetical protein